jgi:Flp pilus assembly protein TadG
VSAKRGRRTLRASGGQSLAEFALVLPVLLFLLFAVLEGSLATFTVVTARYAAGEAAQLVSEYANAAGTDTAAVQSVRTGPLGATSLATVTHVDIYHLLQQGNGQLTVDTSKYNSYLPNGTAISVTWPPASRDVSNGVSDFAGLTIYFQYNWFAGGLLGTGPLQLTQIADVRLEPQTY